MNCTKCSHLIPVEGNEKGICEERVKFDPYLDYPAPCFGECDFFEAKPEVAT